MQFPLDNDMILAKKRQLQQTGHAMFEHGLTLGNAGNLSVRLDSSLYLITASGTHLAELSLDDFVIFNLEDGTFSGGKPSKETPMHSAVYEMRPDAQAVLHASPFYSTLAACSDLEIPNDLFVENMYYLERVRRVSYAHPGSHALGDAVRDVIPQTNVILMENHGVLAADTSLKEALMAMLTLEMTCRMALEARQSGVRLSHLPAEIARAFLEEAGYRARRRWSD